MDDLDDFEANLLYRIAYGEACRIIETRDRNFAHGRDKVRDVALEVTALARDSAGRLGVEPATSLDAVEDVLAGRRPRW